MNLKPDTLIAEYSPVDWDYREVAEQAIKNRTTGKIFFFCSAGICEEQGRIISLAEISREGLFVFLDNGAKVRMDRVITLFGKPGAAYDQYDAYGNSCMECHGGDVPGE